jgi:hypothetical protein
MHDNVGNVIVRNCVIHDVIAIRVMINLVMREDNGEGSIENVPRITMTNSKGDTPIVFEKSDSTDIGAWMGQPSRRVKEINWRDVEWVDFTVQNVKFKSNSLTLIDQGDLSTTVPEPSSTVLLVLGSLLLITYRRR